MARPEGRALRHARRWLYELHARCRARCAGQSAVAGEQHRVQGLREGQIRGVAGSQVVPERPHTIEQRLVGVALEIEIAEVRQGGRRGSRVELAVLLVTAQSLS